MLRGLRRADGLSVEKLASASGVSAGLISQLERGLGNPSFHTLRRLAASLHVPVASFVQGPAGSPPSEPGQRRRQPAGPPRVPGVVRAGERKKLTLAVEGLVYELLTPDLQGSLEVLRTQVPPAFSNADRPFCHEGEECVHLLEGELELTVGDALYHLRAGDTATYDPSVPHWWANNGAETAVIVGVVTPPSF